MEISCCNSNFGWWFIIISKVKTIDRVVIHVAYLAFLLHFICSFCFCFLQYIFFLIHLYSYQNTLTSCGEVNFFFSLSLLFFFSFNFQTILSSQFISLLRSCSIFPSHWRFYIFILHNLKNNKTKKTK